jgi:hypothetical protein
MHGVEAGVPFAFQENDGAGCIFMPGGEAGEIAQCGRIKTGEVGKRLQMSTELVAIRLAHSYR